MEEEECNKYLKSLKLDLKDYNTLKDASSDIHKQFRCLILEWHPDRNLHRQQEATEKFREIEEARTILLAAINEEDNDDDELASYVNKGYNQHYHSEEYLEKLWKVRENAKEKFREQESYKELEKERIVKQRDNARAYHNHNVSMARYQTQAHANMLRSQGLKEYQMSNKLSNNNIEIAKRMNASKQAITSLDAQRYASVQSKRREAAIINMERYALNKKGIEVVTVEQDREEDSQTDICGTRQFGFGDKTKNINISPTLPADIESTERERKGEECSSKSKNELFNMWRKGNGREVPL